MPNKDSSLDSILQKESTIIYVSYTPPIFVPSVEAITVNSTARVGTVNCHKSSVVHSQNHSDYTDDEDCDDNSQADIIESIGRDEFSEKNPETNPKLSKWIKYRGMMLAVVSSLIFTVSALLVKKLETYDPLNSALYKFQGALVPAIPLLLQKRYCSVKGSQVTERVWPLTKRKKVKAFGLVLLRSFLATNALLLHYYSLKYLSIGDALTISAASPILVTIFARIFLGEKCGNFAIIISLVSIIGVVAIAKPPVLFGLEEMNIELLVGSSIAFGCTVITAVSYIVLRHIRKVHYSVTTLAYGGWGSLECLILVSLVPGLAILTLFGQFAIILAMKAEQAGPVAIVRTLDVLFGYIFELALWKVPDTWSLIGAAIITLSVLYVGLRKWVRGFPKDHPVRRKLWFISM